MHVVYLGLHPTSMCLKRRLIIRKTSSINRNLCTKTSTWSNTITKHFFSEFKKLQFQAQSKKLRKIINYKNYKFQVNKMLKFLLKKNYYFCKKSFMQGAQRKPKNFPQFTHFASVPFIKKQHRDTLGFFQDRIQQIFQQHKLDHTLKRANTNLMHITLSMLTLNLQQYREKTVKVFESIQKQVNETLKGVSFKLGDIKYFKKFDKREKKEYVSLFYFEIIRDENTQKLDKVTHLLIRQMIKAEVIEPNELKSMHIRYDHRKGMYVNDAYHMTLFRIDKLVEDVQFKQAYSRLQQIRKEKELNLTFRCQSIDVSTRGSFDQTNFYLPLVRVEIESSEKENNLSDL